MIIIMPQKAKKIAKEGLQGLYKKDEEKHTVTADAKARKNKNITKLSLPNLKNNPCGILSIFICIENIMRGKAMKAAPINAAPNVVRIDFKLLIARSSKNNF